jgi:pimeloyl-ACP methyl ester carboxylesterase
VNLEERNGVSVHGLGQWRSCTISTRRARLRSAAVVSFSALILGMAGGCADPKRGPAVFYLDGAGWYSSSGSVAQGLREGGYKGAFSTYSWSSMLGPGPDHLITARSKGVAKGLAGKIEKLRRADPKGQIDVMGLSAGTAVILSALEQLPAGIEVDNVVLFSPSVSAEHNLTKAMQHVRRNLYATCSPHDAILATLAVNADGESGPPAGRVGFRLPRQAGGGIEAAYRRVMNLPWEPAYLAFDWAGGHVPVTNRAMVAAVIAPRILSSEFYPLDRSVMDRVAMRQTGD